MQMRIVKASTRENVTMLKTGRGRKKCHLLITDTMNNFRKSSFTIPSEFGTAVIPPLTNRLVSGEFPFFSYAAFNSFCCFHVALFSVSHEWNCTGNFPRWFTRVIFEPQRFYHSPHRLRGFRFFSWMTFFFSLSRQLYRFHTFFSFMANPLLVSIHRFGNNDNIQRWHNCYANSGKFSREGELFIRKTTEFKWRAFFLEILTKNSMWWSLRGKLKYSVFIRNGSSHHVSIQIIWEIFFSSIHRTLHVHNWLFPVSISRRENPKCH